MSRILYLSYDGMTDPLGQSQVLPYLSALAKRGYKITLISFEKEAKFRKGETLIRKICEAARISWQPLHYTAKPPVLSTLKDLYRLWKRVQTLQKNHPFQIVHCRSYLTGLIGLRLKNKYGTRFLFDMRGFWADERIEGGIWNPSNPVYAIIYRYFKSKETELLSGADHTISLTDTGKAIIQGWTHLRLQPIPITVIPCCVDVQHFDPATISSDQKVALRKELDISPSSLVISYVGSLGTWYMLPEMLSFFGSWLKKHPDSLFICFTGDDPKLFWTEVKRLELPAEKFRIKSVTRPEMPLHISISDYSVFFIRPVFSKKASSPTKQGEIMAMGVPLICNRGIGDSDRIVETWSAGCLVDAFTELAYEQAIERLNRTQFDRDRIRSGAISYFSLEQGVDRYEQVYLGLLNEA